LSTPETDYYRLRTEWLRFKSHLFDGLTGLPALAAVVEQVRRVVERRGGVEVLYLDVGRSGLHEAKLGWAAYDRAIRDFAEALGALRSAGTLGEEDHVCLHTVRSDRFVVFLAAEAGGEGLRQHPFLRALRRQLDSRNGRRAPARLVSGRALVRSDPMIRCERAIQQAVADAMQDSLVELESGGATQRLELQRLIEHEEVRSVFHPIVRLADGAVIGHEALTRPTSEISFESVEELFAFAESTDLLVDFERLCRSMAIRTAASRLDVGLVFLNASARAVEDPEWATGEMDRLLADSGLTPKDVVVEITERVAIEHHDAFQTTLRTFKKRGYRVAVDDMGAGYSSFQALAAIEPDFLKFDTSLVREIDSSSIKQGLLETLRSLAEKIGARVIAEGVEREQEKDTLVTLGIEFAQGFLFHPAD
jgi:EAL domain-containing protein (putative c-di-GMP-specific phosphodiesterase class I)